MYYTSMRGSLRLASIIPARNSYTEGFKERRRVSSNSIIVHINGSSVRKFDCYSGSCHTESSSQQFDFASVLYLEYIASSTSQVGWW